MKQLKAKTADGFTILELAVVLVIIGILTAVAYPVYKTHVSKSRQSEAKTNLTAIHTAALTYYGANESFFTATFKTIGFQPEANRCYGYIGSNNNQDLDGGSANLNPAYNFLFTPGESFNPSCAADPTRVAYNPCQPLTFSKEQMWRWGGYKRIVGSTEPKYDVGTVGFCYWAFANIDGDDFIDFWHVNQLGSLNNGPPYMCSSFSQADTNHYFCTRSFETEAGSDVIH